MFFANNIDSFYFIVYIHYYAFLEKLSKTDFKVSYYDSLDEWKVIKNVKQKGYLVFSSTYCPYKAHSELIKVNV